LTFAAFRAAPALGSRRASEAAALPHAMTPREHTTGGRRRRRAVILALVATLVEALAVKLRGYRIAGNVVVRCREGHLFTTIWIPGASLKSLRFGWWRFQRCPVGSHWSMVSPISESDLSEREKRTAHESRDIRIP
jgi:hypothetical protein